MKIEWIKIKGFRNFIDEKINFADQTLIIGANDIGKSNLIYALRLLFDRGLSERDLDLFESDYNVYTTHDEIEITVKITNVIEDCLKTVFKGDIENETLYLSYKNSKNDDFTILSGPSEESLEVKNSRFYIRRLNMEYVNTHRNLNAFMNREKNKILDEAKNNLTNQQIQQDESSVNEIKEGLFLVNQKIDKLNYIQQSLKQVNDELVSLAIHNQNQELSFKNANSDMSRILSNLELSYSTESTTLTLGGDGRNNQIFLATWMSKQKNSKSLEKVTFYAIEEPEAHLHPQQQRKLSNYLLDSFDEQIFITTHSPYIASEFKPDKIVKLYSRKNQTKVAKGGCSEDLKLDFDDFGYRLDAITSDVFFVNAVFLVEGPSEKLFYTALAKQMGIDLDFLNVAIISVNGVGFKPYIKICLALEIPFVLRTDNDISKKTRDGVEFGYQAGVSRVIGIYNELLKKSNDERLCSYWEEHKSKNEWDNNIPVPQSSIELADFIIREVESEFNIFISNIDLENDLVDSSLYDSLVEYYHIENRESIIKKMQKAKAENMLDFLKVHYNDLSKLTDDKISEPLKRIQNLAERIVHG